MEDPADSLAPQHAESESTRHGVWQWAGAITGFVVAAVIVGGMLFRVPYVALVPGSAKDTEPLVEVEGIESFPSDGELLFTTVRIRQRPNLWEYLWLRADQDTEFVSEDVILGGRTPEENREFNLQLMNDSKSIAVAVALEELGYDAIKSDGVVIVELVAGGAAEGLIELGDTVVAIDETALTTTGDLVETLSRYEPGDEIVLTVEPFDPERERTIPEHAIPKASVPGTSAAETPVSGVLKIAVVLGAKPDDPEAAFLGVGPTDRVELNDGFDFLVAIDSGSVGGPSAGLAFTLAILDELTAGELTGGATVAVTGTIDVGGRVGPVGGVAQKTAAVRDLGADVFLVPADLTEAELARVKDRAGDDLEIIPVADLDDALAALAGLGGEVAAVEEFAASNLS